MTPAWTENWLWSLPIIGLTLIIHAAAIVMIMTALTRVGHHTEMRSWSLRRSSALCIVAIGLVGWILALLHGIEAAIWACAFLALGAITSPADAMLFSLDSITTRGESGLILQQHWRLMGALEAANGVLLFGISTAFLFTVISEASTKLSQIARGRRPSRAATKQAPLRRHTVAKRQTGLD